MSRLLIDEPPLQVLRSLACALGLNEAIVLQQLHWLARGRDDGWVEKPLEAWQRVFPFWGRRTIERVFANLRSREAIEAETVAGKPTRYRVTLANLAEVGLANLAGESRQSGEGSYKSAEKEHKQEDPPKPPKGDSRKILSPAEEPLGFSEWLGHHVQRCSEHGIDRRVPRAGTTARSKLAQIFARLVSEGYELDDFKLASDGVLADEFMRTNGHSAPDNVLRVERIAKRIDEGRSWRAAQESVDEGTRLRELRKQQAYERLGA